MIRAWQEESLGTERNRLDQVKERGERIWEALEKEPLYVSQVSTERGSDQGTEQIRDLN